MVRSALVCWGGGFIGGHLVRRLKREGFWVRGVDLTFPEFAETEADDFVIGICATRISAMPSSTTGLTKFTSWPPTWAAPATSSSARMMRTSA